MIGFIKGADILVHDAQYTPDDYKQDKHGFGHSTYEMAAQVARLLLEQLHQDSRLRVAGISAGDEDRVDSREPAEDLARTFVRGSEDRQSHPSRRRHGPLAGRGRGRASLPAPRPARRRADSARAIQRRQSSPAIAAGSAPRNLSVFPPAERHVREHPDDRQSVAAK